VTTREYSMIKRLTMWHAKEGMHADVAVGHWTSRHVPLVLAVPGVLRYEQNRCVPGPGGDAPPFAGLGEVWFDSAEASRAALASPQWRAVIDDAATFMNLDRIVVAWAEESRSETVQPRTVP
jgi:uncharacterized protein (TIGR02118 family)